MITDFIILQYTESDADDAIALWNTVVWSGRAFPQEDPLDLASGKIFFAEQTFTGIARENSSGEIAGLYILHPNNVGRCGHICNASYAVSSHSRGLHIGEKLVLDCIEQGREHGFSVLQFNAVVATNIHARHLYERLGFTQLGTIPKGFRMKDGYYEDICPYYRVL
jgi:ribosomal protein S18 acetylase RimI-like enzyme